MKTSIEEGIRDLTSAEWAAGWAGFPSQAGGQGWAKTGAGGLGWQSHFWDVGSVRVDVLCARA